MQVKKIKNAEFHLANGLWGRKPAATYGVFRDGVQIGVVHSDRWGWDAYDMDATNRLNGYTCGSERNQAMTSGKTARQDEISQAIDLSVHENRIVYIETQGESIEYIMADIASVYEGDLDHATENDGSYDIWGWPGGDSEMEWRINVTLTTE